MIRIVCARFILVVFLFLGSLSVLAEERAPVEAKPELAGRAKVYLDVTSSTWRSRGRVSFGLVPSLKMKMGSAGFTVVQNRTDPHDLTLKVEYREERGKHFRIDLYGTDITCTISLEHAQQGPLFNLTIRESPTYADRDTGPYIEVLHRFETNPYYYFLGDLVKGRIGSRLDVSGSLVQGLQGLVDNEPHQTSLAAETDANPANTLPAADVIFARRARDNAILELGRLKEPRAIPVLTKLLEHRDRRVRLLSVGALGSVGSSGTRSAIEAVAQHDGDSEVRAAATAVLADLPSLSPVP